MNLLQKPRYSLNEKVEIQSMGIFLTVSITKRTLKYDIDSREHSYYYELKDNHPIPDKAWTWDNVEEESLREWIISSQQEKRRCCNE